MLLKIFISTPGKTGARMRLAAPKPRQTMNSHPEVQRQLVPVLLLLTVWTGAGAAEPRVYRDRGAPHWLADQPRFWYRNELKDGAREFVLVDAAKCVRQPAFYHARAAAELSKVLSRAVTADKLPVERLGAA